MLGNAIKELNLPREELVIMTKVRPTPSPPFWCEYADVQLLINAGVWNSRSAV